MRNFDKIGGVFFQYYFSRRNKQMPAAYSMDLRERVLNDCDAGMSNEDAARKYRVGISTVYSWQALRRDTGSYAPKEYKRGQKPKLESYEQKVRQLVADHPDATLEALHAQLPNKDDVTVVTLHNFLKRLKITWKKKLSAPLNNIEKTLPKSEKNGHTFKK
jgi:transposase